MQIYALDHVEVHPRKKKEILYLVKKEEEEEEKGTMEHYGYKL